MFALGGIETAALWQPESPSGPYTHPHLFKCVVHYLTDAQEQVYSVVLPLSFIGLLLCVIAGFAYNSIQSRLEVERKNTMLDHIAADS